MTDRQMEKYLVGEGERNYRYTKSLLNKIKEQLMTREEAVERLKNIKGVPSMFIDEIIKELVEVFKQPPTLADFLGWEEGQEYNWKGTTIKIEKNNIYEKNEKCSSNWCNFYVSGEELLDLRQAKKVEVE